MIRYKVVNASRGSCRVLRVYRKYYKEYQKGETVKMASGSFGIMVFKTKSSARNFFNSYNNDAQILQVEPIGKALKHPPFLFSMGSLMASRLSLSGAYIRFKANDFSFTCWDIPPGTLFYESVKVLD